MHNIPDETVWMLGVLVAAIFWLLDPHLERFGLNRALLSIRKSLEAMRAKRRERFPFVVLNPAGGINGARARYCGRVDKTLGKYKLEDGSVWHLRDRLPPLEVRREV